MFKKFFKNVVWVLGEKAAKSWLEKNVTPENLEKWKTAVKGKLGDVVDKLYNKLGDAALDWLEDYAEKTKTTIDDTAVAALRSLSGIPDDYDGDKD